MLSLLPRRFPSRVVRASDSLSPFPFLSPPSQAIHALAAPGVAGSAQFLSVCLGLLLFTFTWSFTSFFMTEMSSDSFFIRWIALSAE